MISSILGSASEQMTVEFPNILKGMEIVYQRSFSIFKLEIFWYGVLIAVGVVLAYIYAMRRVTKDFGIVKDRAFDVIFAAVIGGFLFARIYYCVFRTLDPNSPTKYTIITMFTTIRDGGIAIYGGVIGAVVIGFIFCRIRKVHFRAMADLASLGFLIGQTIGRWGNFINQEAYGDFCPEDWIFGMTGSRIASEMGSTAPVHPCFLYESVWCFLGFIFLHIYSKKLRSFDGEISLLYITWYGFGRMFIEGLRTDSLYWGQYRVSQVLAFVSCTAALITFIICKIVAKKKETVLYVNSEASKELIEHDLKAEYKRLEKKYGKAASILEDNTEKTEDTAAEVTSEEKTDAATEEASEKTTEDKQEEASPSEEKSEKPAADEEKSEEAAPTENKSEEAASTEDKPKETAPAENKPEEPAAADKNEKPSDSEDKKSSEDTPDKEMSSDDTNSDNK